MAVAAPASDRAVTSTDNAPPPERPWNAIKAHADDLLMEARNWCDGAAVESQAQADEVSRLLDDMRKAAQAAETARKEEAKPFDDGKAEVQERYGALIADTKGKRGALVLAIDALKAALRPFLERLEAEKRQAEETARQAAEEARRIASEAAIQAAAGSDLAAREDAERLVREAKQAEAAATRAANDKASAKGGARATTLRTYWVADLTDLDAAVRHYWSANREAFVTMVKTLAAADVAAGKRQIAGFTVREDRRVA